MPGVLEKGRSLCMSLCQRAKKSSTPMAPAKSQSMLQPRPKTRNGIQNAGMAEIKKVESTTNPDQSSESKAGVAGIYMILTGFNSLCSSAKPAQMSFATLPSSGYRNAACLASATYIDTCELMNTP
mmetsp:Transcript_882/g.2433  ORF Transcript_882/g.2433 Transcript_882/m.2433 type:complete len:126 (+) Transcript_882:71-448(+)